MNRKINGHSADYLKRQARNIKKEQGITHLEALNKAAILAGFTGWDNFVNKSKEPLKRKRVPLGLTSKAPSPLVLTYYAFGAKQSEKRPNAKMPIEAHLQMGELLKEVGNATDAYKRAKNALGYVRTTLDDWAQREYSRKELSDDVFFDMYYGNSDAPVEYSPSSERKQQLVSLCQTAKTILTKYYPDCSPLRTLNKKLDLTIKWISRWPAGLKPRSMNRVQTKIQPGTLVRIKRNNKPAILISHDSWNGVVNCYGDGGPMLLARQEIIVPKVQSDAFVFKPMRLWLPYGKWTYSDGTEVLFNRDYRPMWAKRKDGQVVPVDADATVDINGESEFFFNDGSKPWTDKKTLAVCISALQKWGVQSVIPGTLKLLPEAIATGNTDILKYVNRGKRFI